MPIEDKMRATKWQTIDAAPFDVNVQPQRGAFVSETSVQCIHHFVLPSAAPEHFVSISTSTPSLRVAWIDGVKMKIELNGWV